MTTLLSRGRQVSSPFALSRNDENALTAALGYTLHQSPRLLHWFLKQIGVLGIRRSLSRKIAIELQRHSSTEASGGFTDIEIRLPGKFHVIIEAKVGMGLPSLKQCQKYASRLCNVGDSVQRLVTLVASPDDLYASKYSAQDISLVGKLSPFLWSRFLTACTRIITSEQESSEWVRHFYTFLDGDYRMKAYTTEVWIVSVNTSPLWPNGMSFWDIHKKHSLYFDQKHPTVRPLYMAFRAKGKIEAIHRVLSIEHGVVMQDIEPALAHIKGKKWPKQEHTVWRLGESVPLTKPLKTGGGMYNRRVRCDLDLLLTCDTVQQIEAEMGKRKKAPDENIELQDL